MILTNNDNKSCEEKNEVRKYSLVNNKNRALMTT